MKKLMLILPVLSGVFWGSIGIFVRTLDTFGFNNQTIIFSRNMAASLILLIGILIVDKSMLKIKLKDIWIFIVCGLLGMLGLNLCYNEAIANLTLSLAAVLLSLSPIFVMCLAAVILKEHITLKKIGCIALAVFGCALVSGVFESDIVGSLSAIGVLEGIAAAVFYAFYSIASKIAMKQKYSVFTVIFYSVFISGAVLIPFTDWSIIGEFVAVGPVKNIAFIILNALCTSILPYVLYTLALSYVDTAKVSILASGGEPSAAMIFGLVFFAEVPTVLSFCGLVVTIIAIWLLCRPDKKQEISNQ